MVLLYGANRSVLLWELIEKGKLTEYSPFLKKRHGYICLPGVQVVMDPDKG